MRQQNSSKKVVKTRLKFNKKNWTTKRSEIKIIKNGYKETNITKKKIKNDKKPAKHARRKNKKIDLRKWAKNGPKKGE